VASPRRVSKLAFSSDGKRLASVWGADTITIWDASKSMKEIGEQ
jgi:hypothetical protein